MFESNMAGAECCSRVNNFVNGFNFAYNRLEGSLVEEERKSCDMAQGKTHFEGFNFSFQNYIISIFSMEFIIIKAFIYI